MASRKQSILTLKGTIIRVTSRKVEIFENEYNKPIIHIPLKKYKYTIARVKIGTHSLSHISGCR